MHRLITPCLILLACAGCALDDSVLRPSEPGSEHALNETLLSTLPIDELVVTAEPSNIPLSEVSILTVVAIAGGEPAVDRVVRFSASHGRSSEVKHGSFSPPLVMTDTNGMAMSTFTPARPGKVHLEAESEGVLAKFDIKVTP